jgi:hypothetical protein
MRWAVPLALVLLWGAAAQAGEADALRIDRKLRDRHMPYSTILDPVLAGPDSDEIVSYTHCGDSAIWTGHYLAAEAYRWNVTRSPEARENIMEALNGIRKLLDVTGDDTLARCLIPVDSPYVSDLGHEESTHGLHVGIVDQRVYFWVGDTSRDQYLGVFFGLTAAFQMVADKEVQDWVWMLSTRMLRYLLDHGWNVRMPDGSLSTSFLPRPDQLLALLKLGRRANPNEFENAYKWRANTYAFSVLAPIALEVKDPYGSYFKFNLDHITFYDLLTSGDNWWVRLQYQNAFDLLRKTTDDHDNAFFDMIDTAVNGRDPTRDNRVRRVLGEWLERPTRDFWTDLRPKYPSCGGDENRACQVIPVPERPPTDFLWQRSPFQLYGGLFGTIEGAGIDYLLPYWMARFHGVVVE